MTREELREALHMQTTIAVDPGMKGWRAWKEYIAEHYPDLISIDAMATVGAQLESLVEELHAEHMAVLIDRFVDQAIEAIDAEARVG